MEYYINKSICENCVKLKGNPSFIKIEGENVKNYLSQNGFSRLILNEAEKSKKPTLVLMEGIPVECPFSENVKFENSFKLISINNIPDQCSFKKEHENNKMTKNEIYKKANEEFIKTVYEEETNND